MSVSHYVVSGIQVAGLILGLYGFFFLSITTFGENSTRWIRSILPASAATLGVYVVGAAFPRFENWLFGSYALIVGIITYFVSAQITAENEATLTIRERLARKLFRQAAVGILVTLLIGVGVGFGIGLIVLGPIAVTRPHDLLGLLLFVGSLIVVPLILLGALSLPRILTPDRLEMLGFLLTLLAILTQFIPPVLDLLNITITRP
jgi:uncharacterized BrkB/YihY/UPF0761 family membrane protein